MTRRANLSPAANTVFLTLSIEVYTQHENVNLIDIFKSMDASSEQLPSEKDAAAIKKYFEKVYPEMDFDRVYSSDMKKMVRWFGILKANAIELKLVTKKQQQKWLTKMRLMR